MWWKRFQLAFIHVAAALTLLPMTSTLNRVMINELDMLATTVALLTALPYLFSPIQIAIGSYADRHPIFGLRRSPYIVFGLAMCITGAILAPGAAFAMAEQPGISLLYAVAAFGLWGMGFNFATVAYFALSSELFEERERSATMALMFGLMVASMIVMSIVIGAIVDPFTPEALQRAFYITALIAAVLTLAGVLGLEPRYDAASSRTETRHSLSDQFGVLVSSREARIFFPYLILMLAAILGQDVLLEPFAGSAFDMPVSQTTRITSIWGGAMFVTLAGATWLERRIGRRKVASLGAWLALAGFGLMIVSALLGTQSLFYGAVVVLGLGTGFATTSNLALMVDMTTPENVGLYMGAWGLASAMARLIGSVSSAVLRDTVTRLTASELPGYISVFVMMSSFLLVSLVLLPRLGKLSPDRDTEQPASLIERAALVGEAGGG